jgi:heptosyltransferase-1
MMRVLLIKTSSMGDLIHTMPAITDAGKAIPGITFDWVVEDTFLAIPKWHPLVKNVIPVALRRWRKGIFSSDTRAALKTLQNTLRKEHYDLILDAQGLVKSAFLAFFAKGIRAGLDFKSAREPLASCAYQRKYTVNYYQHAVIRMRSLFSQALGFTFQNNAPEFGIHRHQFMQDKREHENYVVFLHGTTWASKEWPEAYWIQLASIAASFGYRIKISGGNEVEMTRAKRIAKYASQVEVLPYLTIEEMATCLARAQAVIAVDTGFGHLAAALNVPTVSIYGATNPEYTGALGMSSIQLAASFECAPCLNRVCSYKKAAEVKPACYGTISPDEVWRAVRRSLR